MAVKYLAAALVASQGSLIHAWGFRFSDKGSRTRLICSLVAGMHYACAGLIIWFAS